MKKEAMKKGKAPEKKEPIHRKPPARMPGGKYVNMPINQIEDCFVLLWNLSPKPMERLTSDQIQAIYKQAGKLLKSAGWKMPEPNEFQRAKIEANQMAKKKAKK